jgi:hypothetical protein
LYHYGIIEKKEFSMCFSPEASFAGGIIISGIGVATYRKVHKPSQLLFASIPVFFGAQQIAEGLLWLTIPDPSYLTIRQISTYIFLTMADVLWPLLIPLSVLFMEEDPGKKKILKLMLIGGSVLSLYYAACLIFGHVVPEISGYHVFYRTDFPDSLAIPAFIVYLVVTITPLFISSIERTKIMGILMFSSCVITGIFYTQYLTSVWCFFAALISCVIFWILSDSRKKFIFENPGLLSRLIRK